LRVEIQESFMKQRLMTIVALLSVLALAVTPSMRGIAGQALDFTGKIDPLVLADTAGSKSAHFLVVLKSQVNTRLVAALNAGQPGQAVYTALSLAASATQPAVVAALHQLGAPAATYTVVNLIATQGDRSLVDAMAARPDVAYITPDDAFKVPLEQPDPVAGVTAAPQAVPWNLSLVHADSLWAKGITGKGIVYANADTGVDWTHPALKSHYRGWNGSVENDAYNWWDAIHSSILGGTTNPCGYSSPHPCDDFGHGTHVMGTGIGQAPGNDPIGVAPGATWIACRNMDDGVGRPSTYIECLDFFLAPWDQNKKNPDPSKRPDVISNSYTCDPGNPPAGELCGLHDLQAAITNLTDAGVFFAAAAGNDGPACYTISKPPALEPAAFTVGATDFPSTTIAGFSSRGPVTVDGSGLRKPDLVAPGTDVVSSWLGGSYAAENGTSMATPHVAGAVALLWAAFPMLRHQVAQTEVLLERTAQPEKSGQLCGLDTADSIPNNVYGYGFLNIQAAYDDYWAHLFHVSLPLVRTSAP
jgi:subtilisin family serine protease